MSTKPAYQFFVGVDIDYRTFTSATLAPGTKAKRKQKVYAQTPQDFERLQKRQQKHGIESATTLVVMEATGSYWFALVIFSCEVRLLTNLF